MGLKHTNLKLYISHTNLGKKETYRQNVNIRNRVVDIWLPPIKDTYNACKKIKNTLFFITIMIVSVFLPELKAQNTIDSLKYLLKTTKNDTIQIDVLLEISKTYINTKLDSSIYYCNLALDISEKSQNELKKPFCLMQFGSIYFSKGIFDKSLKNYLEALNIFTKIGDKNEIAACYNSMANIYYRQKKFDIALEYYKKTLQIDIESGNEYYVAFTYNNIGSIYLELDNNEIALEYFLKSSKIINKLGIKDKIGGISNSLGSVYKNMKNYDTAIIYFKKGIELNKETNNKSELVYSLEAISSVYLNLASENQSKKEYYTQKALKYAQESFDVSLELNSVFLKNVSADRIKQAYTLLGNYKKALEFANIYIITNDTLFNKAKVDALTEMEVKHKVDEMKRQAELDQKTIEVQQARNKAQKTAIILGLIIFIVIVFFVIIILRMLRTLHKTNEILFVQKNEIQTQTNDLETTNIKLKELNATKDKFFSIIAHDLKNPFNSMLGFSEILDKEFENFDTQKQKQFIGIIHKGLQDTFKMLENLLYWSHSQRGTIKFNPGKENLYLLSKETIEILSLSAFKKSISLQNEIPENIFINADKNMLFTIIRNLVSNAIKFTSREGEIVINAHKTTNENNQEFVEITVKDNGVGISAETQSKLFDISENTSTHGTENEAGSGLGLILCKEFVKKHNGKIWIESEIGKGSKFIFTIPIGS